MGFADKYIVPKLIGRDYNKIVETYQNDQDSAESGYLQKELELYPIMDLIDSLDKGIDNYQKEDYYNKITSYKNDLNNLQNIVNKYGVKSVDKSWVYDLHRKYSDDVLPVLGAIQKKEKTVSDYIADESSGKHWLEDPRKKGIQSFVDDAYQLPIIVDKDKYAKDLQTAFQELADQIFTPTHYEMLAGILPALATQRGATPSHLLAYIEDPNNSIIPKKLKESLNSIHTNINKAYNIEETDDVLSGIVISSLFRALGKRDYTNIPSSLSGGDGNVNSTLRYNIKDMLSTLDKEDAGIYNNLVDSDGNLKMYNNFIRTFRDDLHVGSSYETSSKELKSEITKIWNTLGKGVSKDNLFKYYTDDNFKFTEEGRKTASAISNYEKKNSTSVNAYYGDVSIPASIDTSINKLLNSDKILKSTYASEIALLERMSGEKISPNTTVEDIQRMLQDNKNPIDFGKYQDYSYALSEEAKTNVFNSMLVDMQTATLGVKRGMFRDDASKYSINLNAKDANGNRLYSKDDILDIRYNPIQNKMYAYIQDKENEDNNMVILDISNTNTSQDKYTRNVITNLLNNEELSQEDKKKYISKLLNALFSSAGNVTGTNNVN